MKNRRHTTVWLPLLALALWSCEGTALTDDGSGVTPGAPDATVQTDTTTGVPDTIAGVPDTTAGVPDTTASTPDTTAGVEEVLSPADTETPDTSTEDTASDCPGCFGAPCEEHLDCLSGWCVDGPDGMSCTKTCDQDCPAGYSCRQLTLSGGDPVFLCLYDHVHFCRPCTESEQCHPPLIDASTARCMELVPGDGSFCATPCEADLDCPAGAACVDVEIAGTTSGLCQPTSLTCECSTRAILAEAKTDCSISNDAGTCVGERECLEEGLSECSAQVPEVEICDGVNNDCDEQTDEDIAEVGASCDGDDEDACTDGLITCEGGVMSCNDDADTAVELCNDTDDDCDGNVDEGFLDKGLPCDGDDDDLCTEGLWTCDGEALVCADATGNAVELCNDADDDCDGLVDEGFAGKGDPCDGDDSDSCIEGTLGCNGQILVCSDTTGDTPELCNEDDDDCDGEIDEAFLLKGVACDGLDADNCEEGAWICDGQVLVCSDDAAAIAEVCNDADDDCDGSIDETFADKGTSCDGDDADDCKGGYWVCQGDALMCDDDVTTSEPELCNNGDDDCDGNIDEDFPLVGLACDGDDTDLCSDGEWVCDGQGILCTDDAGALAEYCNDSDDDCDGLIDEGYPEKGAACDGLDDDLCADGVQACAPSGTGLECTDDEGSPVEVCDDTDNDCDGAVDEGFGLKGEPCDGLDDDLCEGGTWICDGQALHCSDDIASIVENCNTEDDDCDGVVDEGFEAAGDPCDGADADLCNGGTWGCNGVDLSCSDDDASIPELCNESDDDCDGEVDEAFPLLGNDCDGDDDDQCAGGVWVCDGEVAICNDDNATVVELCNGDDDDCDGQIDEGYAGLGAACDGDDDDLCESGNWVCTEDGTGVLCDDDEETSVELCNESDDDCDGEVDEPFTLKGSACDGDDDDLCTTGQWVCGDDGTGLVCTDDDASTGEVCNDADDDCDGGVDEDFGDKGLPCDGDDSDQCEDGTWICGAAGLVCTDDGTSLPDVCNGIDDDCDGVVDPGCCDTAGQACCEGDTCNAPLTCSDGTCICEAQASTICDEGDVWWVDCQGAVTGAKELCGSCGCVGGQCNHVDPPICAPDQVETETEACGYCGTRSRTQTCQAGCTWGGWTAWSTCNDQGECPAGDADTDSQGIDCGSCGTQQQERTRSCNDSCQWSGWSGWSDVGECTNAGVCSPGNFEAEDQDNVPCGLCGTKSQTRSRSCSDGCGWGVWGEWTDTSACNNQGICSPSEEQGDDQTIACGNCGDQEQQRSRSCSGSCQWETWGEWQNVGSCSGSGDCSAGNSEVQHQDNVPCGLCGTKSQSRSRSCADGCGWGAWGDWTDTSVCSNQGVCTPGTQNPSSQYVGCGLCGSQQQQQVQTCTDSCQWGGWSGWSNVGGCTGSGTCSPNQQNVDTQYVGCGLCGSQMQQNVQTCSGSCQWGGWSGWYNVGGCSGSGDCNPGTAETQQQTVSCGSCGEGSQTQERSRSCSGSCGWNGWSSWTNVGGCNGQGCVPGSVTDINGSCGMCGDGITWDACTNSCTWTPVCWGALEGECCGGDWQWCTGGSMCSTPECWQWCNPATGTYFPCQNKNQEIP